MFSPRTANGIGKISLIGEHTTRNGTTTESRKAGGNTATSTRTTYNNKIDCTVVGWMPLPPKEVTQNGNQ